MRALLIACASLGALSGCGLAATGTTAAAGAQAQADEAAEARKTEEQVRQRIEAAELEAQQKRADAQRQTE